MAELRELFEQDSSKIFESMQVDDSTLRLQESMSQFFEQSECKKPNLFVIMRKLADTLQHCSVSSCARPIPTVKHVVTTEDAIELMSQLCTSTPKQHSFVNIAQVWYDWVDAFEVVVAKYQINFYEVPSGVPQVTADHKPPNTFSCNTNNTTHRDFLLSKYESIIEGVVDETHLEYLNKHGCLPRLE
jgi:hypothetical protein